MRGAHPRQRSQRRDRVALKVEELHALHGLREHGRDIGLLCRAQPLARDECQRDQPRDGRMNPRRAIRRVAPHEAEDFAIERLGGARVESGEDGRGAVPPHALRILAAQHRADIPLRQRGSRR